MPAVHWYESSQPPLQSTQGPCHQIQWPQLSQEAHTAIKEHHLDSQLKYNSAVVTAVSNFEKAASDVASTHHKSLCCVEQDVCLSSDLICKHHRQSNAWNAWVWHKSQDKENLGMASKHTHNKEVNWHSTSLDLDKEGKYVLPALIAKHKEEYEKLSPSKIKEIVHLYKEHKATKATAWCVSIQSRINNTTQTSMAIETEVSKNSRTLLCPTYSALVHTDKHRLHQTPSDSMRTRN